MRRRKQQQENEESKKKHCLSAAIVALSWSAKRCAISFWPVAQKRCSVTVVFDVSEHCTAVMLALARTVALRVVVGFVFVLVSFRCADFFLLLRCTVESIIFFSALSRTMRELHPPGPVQYEGVFVQRRED